eukprot:COSAG01_NODE_16555_length_1226_cov_6.269743_1_plen_76_part_10
MADAAPGPWPLELQELVSYPPVAEFLTSLGVDSLAAFAEIVDLEEIPVNLSSPNSSVCPNPEPLDGPTITWVRAIA